MTLMFPKPSKTLKKSKPRKNKFNSYKVAKTNAWDAFSRYIRLRDALKTTKTRDTVICITCDVHYPAFGRGCCQAGHLVPGRGNSVLFDEKFVNSQCYNCNVVLKGNWVPYRKKMVEMWGLEAVEAVENSKGMIKKYSIQELNEIEELYKHKYEEL